MTGTIVFGPLGLYAQSDMDFIDAHAYWQHPRFPGRPWDQGNWLVDQKPMVNHPEEATLFRLAAERLAGKPFTVSEYNHPAPMDSQAECVPLITSFAAAQDWDGLWLYTYSHSGDDWDREKLSGFFDIDTNPAKWGFMRAGTAIFRDAALLPVNPSISTRLTLTDSMTDLIQAHLRHDRNMLSAAQSTQNLSWENLVQERVYVSLGSSTIPAFNDDNPTVIHWSAPEDKGVYMAAGGAGVLGGQTSGFDEASDGYAKVVAPDFAVITATPLDGQPWINSRRILVTACGRSENVGMGFSEDRNTVGREWGQAPASIEPVTGKIMIIGERWRCQALGPDGRPLRDIPTETTDGNTYFELSPQHKTMWYLLTNPKG